MIDQRPANAGLTGVLMAMSALSQHVIAPIASLRNINPYVGTTLADLAAKGLETPLPRQASGDAHRGPWAASYGNVALKHQ